MREQVGPGELSALLLGFLLGSSLVLPMGIQAKQAAWLAVALGGAGGLGVAWIYTSLALRFPDQSLIGYSKRLLGKWLGGLVGLLYIWYAMHLGALVLRNFGEFLVTTILPSTPISVLILCLAGLAAYGSRHGAAVLGRAAQVMIGMVALQVLLTSTLLVMEMRVERLLPLLESGPVPVLRGAFSTLSFPFGEAVLFALLLPLLRPVKQTRRTMFSTIGAAALFLSLMQLRNMAVVGAHLMGSHRFPTLGVAQQVDIADFLTRLDALVVSNWIVTGFLKVSVCLLAAARGIADWAGLQEYRPLVLPLGSLLTALSLALYSNISDMERFASTIWPVYSVPFQILIPLLLLAVAKVEEAG